MAPQKQVRKWRTQAAVAILVSAPLAGGCSGGSGATAESGRGFTEDEVFVGFNVSVNAEEAAGQAGLESEFGDQEAQIEAIVADINERGGVLGRSVVPVFHEVDATVQDPTVLSQAACTAWTQDNEVAAVALTGLDDETMMGCLHDAAIPEFVELTKAFDNELVAPFAPNVVGLSGLSLDRMVPTWVERLDAQGYFDSASAVGVAYGSTPITDRAVPKLEDALSDIGVELAVDAPITDQASVDSGVLRLKDAAVDRVLLLDGVGFVFIPQAESQDFHPRYAVSSISYPNLLQTNVPAEALSGAVGMGWLPSLDVDAAQDPGPVSDGAKRCLRLMADAGQQVDSRDAIDLQLGICETLWAFAAAAEAGGGLSEEAVTDGVAELGESFDPLKTFTASFDADRPDTVGGVRDLAFDDGCSCFVYVDDMIHAVP